MVHCPKSRPPFVVHIEQVLVIRISVPDKLHTYRNIHFSIYPLIVEGGGIPDVAHSLPYSKCNPCNLRAVVQEKSWQARELHSTSPARSRLRSTAPTSVEQDSDLVGTRLAQSRQSFDRIRRAAALQNPCFWTVHSPC